MEAFIYLGKSSLVLALFYCCFQLFLRNETFFTAKRWFLIAGIAIAMIFPFVILKRIVAISTPSFDINAFVNATTNAEIIIESTDWWFVGVTIYAAGVAFFLIRFGIQLLSLRKLISEGEIEKKDGFKMVRVSKDTSAFSFFNYVVYNPELHTPKQLATIIEHEKLHSIQKHSIDMLLAHLVCMLQWANPLAWLYKKTLSQNLEFLADAATTTNLNNKKEYQYLLLHQSNPNQASISFTNTFFNSIIKKRIVMLNKNKSKKQSLLKMGVVVPFLAIALFTINTKTIAQVPMSVNTTAPIVKTWGVSTGVKITSKFTDEELKRVSNEAKIIKIDLKFEKIRRNASGEITAISSSFKYGETNSGNFDLSGIKPIKPFQFAIKMTADGKEVEEVAFKTGVNASQPLNRITVEGHPIKGKKKPLFFIDGKEMDESFDENQLNPENIDSISILKGEKAEDVYGAKAKNGVVMIATKGNQQDINAYQATNKLTVVGQSIYGDKKPLIVLDGIEMESSYDLESINPVNIESVSVLKGKKAKDAYGAKGKYGVVVITSNNSDVRTDQSKTKTITHRIVTDKKPLIVLDGKEMESSFDMESIDPDNIKSVNVLKGEKATEKYGKKGKDGVVEITTKK
ncbi:TonB-dependent receptor plug domain-containing protein [Cellulophaga sp. F20128]|uniref:M56 family metallopeptidase n=1 Tax=Cellulophaga sp. F20128 TaxID=2926413 RepID=UPI001FF49D1A|nr:M56 family metallopeptidase [Cellulophaga sp. F20128]MCK0155842.1 TonB-dependent receptor plug domain-containing protein [Cellulophaga sp. F20128]